MSTESRVYGFDEVATHNQKEDCWLIISNKVYDVTRFLDDHPGGDEVLLQATGKDATDDFEDVGHSDDARDMMKNYYVGEVDVSTVPLKPKSDIAARGAAQTEQGSMLVKVLQFLLPLLMLGLAFALKYFKKD